MADLSVAAFLYFALGVGTAWAQATSLASQDQKKAISNSCTDQANEKWFEGCNELRVQAANLRPQFEQQANRSVG